MGAEATESGRDSKVWRSSPFEEALEDVGGKIVENVAMFWR